MNVAQIGESMSVWWTVRREFEQWCKKYILRGGKPDI
jgi:hypothetical protein